MKFHINKIGLLFIAYCVCSTGLDNVVLSCYAQSVQSKFAPAAKSAPAPTGKASALLLGLNTNAGYKTLYITMGAGTAKVSGTKDYILAPTGSAGSPEQPSKEKFKFMLAGTYLEVQNVSKRFSLGREFTWYAHDVIAMTSALEQVKKDMAHDFEVEKDLNQHFLNEPADEKKPGYMSWALEAIEWVGNGFFQKDHYYEQSKYGSSNRVLENTFIPLGDDQTLMNKASVFVDKKTLKSASDSLVRRNRQGQILLENDPTQPIPDTEFMPENLKIRLYRKKGVMRYRVEPTMESGLMGDFYVDMGKAPATLINHNEGPANFDEYRKINPDVVDVLQAPTLDVIFVVTNKEILGVDPKTGAEVLNYKLPAAWLAKSERYYDLHPAPSVVMAEWAKPEQLAEWAKAMRW